MKKLFTSFAVLALMAGSFGTSWAHSEEELAQRAEQLERAQELRQQYEAERQEQLERAREIREEMASEMEERRVQMRAELEERLTERAQNRAEQVAKRLNQVNDNVTDAMLNHLSALENALDALVSRIDRLDETSKADLASTITAADDAYARIASARDAVLAQKEKVYTVEIDSMEGAGEAFRAVAQELKEDLRALVADELRPSRDAVRVVFSELKAAIQSAREELEQNEDEDEE